MSALIHEEELLQVTGFKNRAHLERCLRDQGVKLFHGKGGRIFTTEACFTAAPKREEEGFTFAFEADGKNQDTDRRADS